jgi:hypothetical protein
MSVTICEKCSSGWDAKLKKCTILTGAEEFDNEDIIPECPISKRCQHQIQSKDKPCIVKQKGIICKSALKYANIPETDVRWENCFSDI